MSKLLDNILYLIDSNYQRDGDFEREYGVAKSTVSAWRRGKLKSYAKHAPKIAAFFGVSLDWMSGTEQKNKPLVNGDEGLTEYLEELRTRPEIFLTTMRLCLLSSATIHHIVHHWDKKAPKLPIR